MIHSKHIKVSSLDESGIEIASYIIDVSDLTRLNNRIGSVLDINLDDVEHTSDHIYSRICKQLCEAVKQIVR